MRTSSRSVLNQASIPSFSPQDVPASRQVVPGSDEARKMTVGSGMRLLEFSKSPIQLGQSLKMLRDYLVLKGEWYSTICLLNWKERVTKSGRLLFQLAPSTPRTEGTGCGLLHTPRAMEVEESQEKFVKRMGDRTANCVSGLKMQIAMLPTPNSCDSNTPNVNTGHDQQKGYLRGVIATMLPTPATRDYKGARKPETLALTGRNPETNSLEDALVGKNRGLKLQPAFVEWMMGYPESWTELTD